MDSTFFWNHYRISCSSIRGRRSENQDCIDLLIVDEDQDACCKAMVVAVVCDGMGGMRNGGEASRFVVGRLMEWAKSVRRDGIEEVCIALLTERMPSIEKDLMNAYDGAGTTLSMVIGMEGRWASLHLGDSRCYCLRNGEFEFRTFDHSPVEAMRKAGIIEEEEMEGHPMKNIISKYVGGGYASQVEIQELKPWDTLVLCSDGAYGCMPEREFIGLIRDSDAESIAQQCYERGSQDNISVIKLEKISEDPVQRGKPVPDSMDKTERAPLKEISLSLTILLRSFIVTSPNSR